MIAQHAMLQKMHAVVGSKQHKIRICTTTTPHPPKKNSSHNTTLVASLGQHAPKQAI